MTIKKYSQLPKVIIYNNHLFFIAINIKKAKEAEFLNADLSQEDIAKLSEELQVIIDTIEEKEMRWFELAEKFEG